MIDGLRTRVTFDPQAIGASLTQEDVDRASAVKEAHVTEFMSQKGIQGIGVAISKDGPAEPALAIYVIRGTATSSIPATVDGIRTQIIEGERFHAY
jgi:hypothetical protein